MACMNITAPANGNITYSDNLLAVYSLATVKCDYGYELLGDQFRECLSNGTWSGTDATCECKLKMNMIFFLIGHRLFIDRRICIYVFK